MKIAAVCGSFHKEEIQRMLEYAENEANINGAQISKIIWVPGSMEVPLALDRLLKDSEVDAAIALGIIERGETQHGLVMGQAVTRSIIELQIKYDKSIGLGIIGPGAEKHHIEPRLEPHARSAVNAVIKMSK